MLMLLMLMATLMATVCVSADNEDDRPSPPSVAGATTGQSANKLRRGGESQEKSATSCMQLLAWRAGLSHAQTLAGIFVVRIRAA